MEIGPLHIGMTFDLRTEYLAEGYSEEEVAEFDSEHTIASIEETLRSLGHTTERIGNAKRLAERLVRGDRWELVFNIAEGLHGVAREAQVPALLELYGVPYTFSDPLVCALTLHKALTKRVVRDAGVPTPDFVLVERLADLDGLRFDPPWFAKPLAEGTGKGITARSVVRRPADLAPLCAELLATYRQPVLVERFLPGRELTVGITGTGPDASVIGTMEVLLGSEAEPGVYSYLNKEDWKRRVSYRLARPAEDPVVAEGERVALAAWRALGCRDGGRVDVRCDESGQPQFIEVNPLAGLTPGHSDLPFICDLAGIPYRTLIGRIVASAAARLGNGAAPSPGGESA